MIALIFITSMLFLGSKLLSVKGDSKASNSGFQTSIDMNGKKLIVEVRYENNKTRITVALPDGRTIGSEESYGRLKESEVKLRAVKLVNFLKMENRHQAMSRIVFYGMQKGIPDNESTKAANAFGECIDKGKNPDECVNELKSKHPWLSEINFSDFILLYKKW